MTARVLEQLETLLSGIYDLDIGCRVGDFLVTDRALLPGECRDAPGDEQLFVAADGDELRVSLYLDAGVLERLERHDPSDALDAENLADCWTALEGISQPERDTMVAQLKLIRDNLNSMTTLQKESA